MEEELLAPLPLTPGDILATEKVIKLRYRKDIYFKLTIEAESIVPFFPTIVQFYNRYWVWLNTKTIIQIIFLPPSSH